MKYKIWNKKEEKSFVIRIDDEEYKGVMVEISNLELMKDDVEFEFEFALEEKNKHLYDDNKFHDYLSKLVGDIFVQSISNIVQENSQQKIATYEMMLVNLFKEYNKNANENETYLETIGRKGYYVTEDEDKFMIVNIETNKKFYFHIKEDMDNFIEIFFRPNLII